MKRAMRLLKFQNRLIILIAVKTKAEHNACLLSNLVVHIIQCDGSTCSNGDAALEQACGMFQSCLENRIFKDFKSKTVGNLRSSVCFRRAYKIESTTKCVTPRVRGLHRRRVEGRGRAWHNALEAASRCCS